MDKLNGGGVVYLHNLLEPARLKEYVYRLWPTISGRKAHLVVLNGVWPAVQELQEDFRDLALRSHVVVADDPRFKPEQIGRAPGTTGHVLKVSDEKENRIRVAIQLL